MRKKNGAHEIIKMLHVGWHLNDIHDLFFNFGISGGKGKGSVLTVADE